MNFPPDIASTHYLPNKEYEAHTMKTFLTFTLATTLVCALPVWATCTPEEATAKREQLAQEVTKLTQQNPAKAKQMNDELQAMDLETASKDVRTSAS